MISDNEIWEELEKQTGIKFESKDSTITNIVYKGKRYPASATELVLWLALRKTYKQLLTDQEAMEKASLRIENLTSVILSELSNIGQEVSPEKY